MWSKCLDERDRVTFVYCNDGGEVTGFSSAVVFAAPRDGFDAYLQTIYLLAATKGKGAGRALLRATAAELLARGCKNMSLRVLGENPARGFYERLGARLVPEGISSDAGVFPGDVVYAFDDLRVLL
jgi:ribosomal protein S18 acetylase RimI-like enzyme